MSDIKINNYSNQQRGFTIIELLIVIVVIAILATISVVAYNGIQQRSRDAKRTTDIATIEKALHMWSIEGGKTFADMPVMFNGIRAAGWFDAGYGNPSTRQVLIDSGYLNKSVNDPINSYGGGSNARGYMIVPCNNGDDSSRVIMTNMESEQPKSLDDQLGNQCDSAYYEPFKSYYGMDYGRLIKLE